MDVDNDDDQLFKKFKEEVEEMYELGEQQTFDESSTTMTKALRNPLVKIY